MAVIIAASTKNKLVVELQKHRAQGPLYNGGPDDTEPLPALTSEILGAAFQQIS